ncbi:MAG: SMC-Scp complex subunit ScpB [Chloroflexota bacterium]|nr:SMC-Scp complex subunit ScpB [Chloroflexota bacterium]
MSGESRSVGQQLAALEALLFVTAEPVSLTDLQRVLGVEVDWLKELITTLNSDYTEQGRGLRIYSQSEHCQLVTAPEVASYVEKFLGLQSGSKLSAAALETLTVIAYRQPLTRQGVEAIRGVDSSGVINTLQARGLIEEVGRQESVGHPVLFGTTFEFLHQFGLASLKELPPLKELEEPLQSTPADSLSL